MGQYDTALKQYLDDETRFADLINGVIGKGQLLVSPDQLEDRDPQSLESLSLYRRTALKQHRGPHKKIHPKSRDLVRKAVFGVNFMVIGIEHQEHTHYLMPLRCMGYETREYERQARKHGKQILNEYHEKRIQLTDAEYLCRFRKENRLHPCITIVLYFGDEWDGATSLLQLLNLQELPEEFIPFINDYRIHVLPVKQLENTDIFHSDLHLVFDSIRFADNTEAFRTHVLQNPAFQSLDDDAYHMIQTYSHSPELDQLEQTIYIKSEGGAINMCKAITELIAEGKEEGRLEGRLEGKLETKKELVHSMYKNGVCLEQIMQIASLSFAELESILSEQVCSAFSV